MVRIRLSSVVVASAGLALVAACKGQTKEPSAREPMGDPVAIATNHSDRTGPPEAADWRPAVNAKPMSKNVATGLAWLVAHQLPGGGWGQGDEAATMGSSPQQTALAAKANVADTSMAIAALMRSGSTPSAGEYREQVRRGISFVLSEIEEADADSLYVTEVRGTRVQGKIGTYVDTFTALMILTEAKGKMPSEQDNARLDRGLAKVLAKIEKNQRDDGTWDNRGWAPVLSQSIAAKGLNRAAQAGEKVDDKTLAAVEKQARSQFDAKSGSFGGGDSAGVDLYAGAANSSSLRDSTNTRKTKNKALKQRIATARTEGERHEAQRELDANTQAEIATDTAEQALLKRLEDPQFIKGFGNNGGEEFLSYMLVSEALVVTGGADWQRWDEAITKLVNGVQNDDGSWTGHHCITGRTFCTAAALLVLLADRAPVPVAAKLKG